MKTKMQPVTTYYLEMLTPVALNAKTDSKDLVVSECTVRQYQFNRFLYTFIGGSWSWTDKRSWSDGQWETYVENDNLRTWAAYLQGSIAGYFELLRDQDSVEIIYFGLARAFIGKGYGGFLLTEAIRYAWKWKGVKRVWVHTCTLDHPGALQNYLSRGMSLYKKETVSQA